MPEDTADRPEVWIIEYIDESDYGNPVFVNVAETHKAAIGFVIKQFLKYDSEFDVESMTVEINEILPCYDYIWGRHAYIVTPSSLYLESDAS